MPSPPSTRPNPGASEPFLSWSISWPVFLLEGDGAGFRIDGRSDAVDTPLPSFNHRLSIKRRQRDGIKFSRANKCREGVFLFSS